MSFLKFKNRFFGVSSQKQKERVKEGVRESDISGFSQEFVSLLNWRIFLGGICPPSSPVVLFWWMKDFCREFQATPYSTESETEYQSRT